jgi:hypothetical protein
MIRSHSADREPGLKIETLGATMSSGTHDVEIRLTNPAGAGNVVTGLYLESAGKLLAAEGGDGALNVPFVIQAAGVITGHVTFRVRDERWRDGAIVVIDLDGRHVTTRQ